MAARVSADPGLVTARLAGTLLLVGVISAAPPQVPLPTEAERQYQISIHVDLVVLNATVRDRMNRPADGLHQSDFEVYENGVRQPLRLFRHEDIPVTVGLVIDHSGSMGQKLPEILAAARAFIRASNPEDEMFVVNFNEHVTAGKIGTIRLASHLEAMESAILNVPATGQTALYDAVYAGMNVLQAGGKEKKVLVVISDGGDNASARTLNEVVKRIEQSSVLVYTIGVFDPLDPDRNPGVLRRLARATGGEAYFPKELGEIVAICERVARDIRNQYTLGYAAATAAPGHYRNIRVGAKSPAPGKLTVRTRAGYLVAAEPPANKRESGK